MDTIGIFITLFLWKRPNKMVVMFGKKCIVEITTLLFIRHRSMQIVEALRMQKDVQRHLYEQLEVWIIWDRCCITLIYPFLYTIFPFYGVVSEEVAVAD